MDGVATQSRSPPSSTIRRRGRGQRHLRRDRGGASPKGSATVGAACSEHLGHESPAFTLKQYAHVIPGMQAEAAAQVASLVDRPRQDV